MKTTTIGRIGAIVAGAAMLGTAVASAFAGAVEVPAGVTKGFFVDANGAPQVQVVVGEKAQASDGAAAGQIAAMIGNMAFGTTTVSQAGGTVDVPGGTTQCIPSGAECNAGTATGAVKLSWAALGMVGDLEQKQMTCDVYDDGMVLTSLTDGGDGPGNWADDNEDYDTQTQEDFSDYVEVYTPEDTVANTMIGSCEVTATDVSILKTGEFPNEICSICYNYCDIALGCEPHQMSEWVEIDGEKLSVEYNCDEEKLLISMDEGAVMYNVFTDDIVSEDILSDDDKLVAQSYLGKIILGQHEYYVEDLDDNSITIVCGGKGTVTTSAAMEYIPPAEGSACDAADSGDRYSIKLVGAQTIEEKGVVDVTLEVTKPDGTTEQITSGISGTPVVGDIKVKLQRGTAASNVITGESSFSADILIWYVPSEYTFETDAGTGDNNGMYDEAGVAVPDGDASDVRAAWLMELNGDDELLTVDEMHTLEEAEDVYTDLSLPDGIEENTHYSDCYEDAENTSEEVVVRWIQFTLQELGDSLQEDELVQLPFYDGKYLLSDLKFGYKGLYDENFRDWDLQDKTVIEVEVVEEAIYNESTSGNVYGDFSTLDFRSGVELSFTDENGNSWDKVRVDEGPFEVDDEVLFGDDIVRIAEIDEPDNQDTATTLWNLSYELWDETDWDDDEDNRVIFTDANCADPVASFRVDSQLNDTSVILDCRALNQNVVGTTTDDWYIDNQTEDSDDDPDPVLYIDWNNNGKFDMVSGFAVTTEFDDVVDIDGYTANWVNCSATGSTCRARIVVDGDDDSGAEDDVIFYVDDSAKKNASDYVNNTDSYVNLTYDGTGCELVDSDCEDIAYGESDGVLLSLSGALVEVTGSGDEIGEPDFDEDESYTNDEVVVNSMVMTIPENELRPTIFFGTMSTSNSSSVTITEADVDGIIDIGGIDVTVEEFGVSVSGGGVAVTGATTTVQCPSQTATCPAVSVSTSAPVTIGYKLVVLDSEGASKANLVLVGGPAVNEMTKDLVTVDELCAGGGTAVIKSVASKLVVAGCDAADTASAADALVAWLKNA